MGTHFAQVIIHKLVHQRMRNRYAITTCQILLLAALPGRLSAQVSYSFEETLLPYQPLDSATICTFDTDGFDRINELDGELITLFGVPIILNDDHPLHVGDFGFVRVDHNNDLMIVDGLFTTLEVHDQNTEVRYTVTGASGARVLTVEWHRWHLSNGPAMNYASWQIRLEQATGIITVHIGPNSGGGTLFTNTSGPNCGVFHAPTSFATCYEKMWVEGQPAAITVDSTANFDFDALFGFPAAHTLYRFTPRFAVTGLAPEQHPAAAQLMLEGTFLTLQWPATGAHIDVQLLDASGRTVHRDNATGGRWHGDIGRLPAGVYVLQAQSGGAVFTRCIVRP